MKSSRRIVDPNERWTYTFMVFFLVLLALLALTSCTATIPLGSEARFGTVEISYWPPFPQQPQQHIHDK